MVVTINWQGVKQIANYAGKLLLIFKNVSLHFKYILDATDKMLENLTAIP